MGQKFYKIPQTRFIYLIENVSNIPVSYAIFLSSELLS